MNVLRKIEKSLLAIGLLMLAVFIAVYLDSKVSYRAELQRFREMQRERTLNVAGATQQRLSTDFSLWSDQRVAAYKDSLLQPADMPLAVLRVAKVNLEVPVLEGTSELALNRGVGHIAGTEIPGKTGNIGIAGHRDGFFRALKDVGMGDTVELETLDRTDIYRIDQVVIVDPADVSVLAPRSTPSLTLVTCYPFYFVGSAPKRYILQASLVRTALQQTVAQQRPPSSSSFQPVQRNLSPKSQKSTKEINQ
jgi:sortase A